MHGSNNFGRILFLALTSSTVLVLWLETANGELNSPEAVVIVKHKQVLTAVGHIIVIFHLLCGFYAVMITKDDRDRCVGIKSWL